MRGTSGEAQEILKSVSTLSGRQRGTSQALTRMDGRELKESIQLSERKGSEDTKCMEEKSLESNANEHSKNMVKTIHGTNGLNEKSNNASTDMIEDLPGDKNDIQIQDTSVAAAEKKKENPQNGQQLITEKKAKSVPKQNYKRRHTVSQPFSSSSEKRMSKTISHLERSNPSLSRSLSFKSNSPAPVRTVQTSLRLERTTELRQGTTKSGSIQHVLHTQTSLKVERSIELRNGSSKSNPTDKEDSEKQVAFLNQKKGNGQGKQVEIKKSQSCSNPKDMDINKLGKSLQFKATPLPSFYHKRSTIIKSESTEIEQEMELKKLGNGPSFKAAPLPSFYHRRSMSLKPDSPEKIEEKSVNNVQRSSTFKATPLPSFYQKRSPPRKPELIKIPVTRSKSSNVGFASKCTSELGNNKMESSNNVASRQISDNAKETIKSLLKGPWKAPHKKSKVSRNVGPSCGDEVEKRVVSSTGKSEIVISN